MKSKVRHLGLHVILCVERKGDMYGERDQGIAPSSSSYNVEKLVYTVNFQG